jgi:ATP-dependent Zn protease
MNSERFLEAKGFYSEIKKFSSNFMTPQESTLCQEVTRAFDEFNSETEVSNVRKNAKASLNTAKSYLKDKKRVVNGFSPNFDLPHSMFAEYLITELVSGIKQSPYVSTSGDAIRFTTEYFSSLEDRANIQLGANSRPVRKAPSKPTKGFSELAGYESEYQRIRNSVISQLRDSDKLKEIGIKPPKGVILYGPPGTGKTSIAKAISKESDINLQIYSGSEFICSYVGEGAKKVRNVFETAREKKPSIVFVDEADVCLLDRSLKSSEKRDDVIAQWLTSLEGVRENDQVSVVLSTNRIEVLDPAILSRFRKQDRIYLPLPEKQDRKKIKHDIGSLEFLVDLTQGWSGRDIDNFVQECAWNAYNNSRKKVSMKDLEEVLNAIK